MDSGFITLSRKILDWEWYKNPNTMRVFIHCLLLANWKDGRFEGHRVPRGSFVSSYQSISKGTGLSVQQTKTAIKHLILTRELTKSSFSKFSIFTVVNYDLYQDANKVTNKQVTSNQQASNHNRTKKQGNKGTNIVRTNRFNSFEQRDIDFDELEKGLLEVNQNE